MTFCKRCTIMRMWYSCGCRLSPTGAGDFLRQLRQEIRSLVDVPLALNSYEGCVVLMTTPGQYDVTNSVQTDEGLTVVYQRNCFDTVGRMLRPDVAHLCNKQNVHLSLHRCIMKAHARNRFGTYSPYETQDFISIALPEKRQIYVISAGDARSASVTIHVTCDDENESEQCALNKTACAHTIYS